MTTVREIEQFLEEFAPPDLAEDWDNVGLLLGCSTTPVSGVLTCLTLTPDVAQEAIDRRVGLIISHHPILFAAVRRLTTDTTEGRMLLALSAEGVAVYSPHTGYDSARQGVNQQLAESLELADIRPLRVNETPASDELSGSGRCGSLPGELSLPELVDHVRAALGTAQLQYVAGDGRPINRIGVACGSAAEFLADAAAANCGALITGEARFHACLEARARGVAMILLGHFASERPAMEHLAQVLSERFSGLDVVASEVESDPVQWA